MSTTRMHWHVKAPRARVYAALLDADSVQKWMVPSGMTSRIHAFDAREGGSFRISLTYEVPNGTGKTSSNTDTHHGTFVKLVPDELVVQLVEFETPNPDMQGEMRISYELRDVDGGTDIIAVHEGLPDAVAPEENELGWKSSLGKLAALVESGSARGDR